MGPGTMNLTPSSPLTFRGVKAAVLVSETQLHLLPLQYVKHH